MNGDKNATRDVPEDFYLTRSITGRRVGVGRVLGVGLLSIMSVIFVGAVAKQTFRVALEFGLVRPGENNQTNGY